MANYRSARDMDVEQGAKLVEMINRLKASKVKDQHEIAELEYSNKKLQAADLFRKDEIRSLKNDARSKEEEIVALNQTVETLEKQLLEAHKQMDEIRSLKNDARSKEEEIVALNQTVETLEKQFLEAHKQMDEIRSLKNDARSKEEEIVALNQTVETLEKQLLEAHKQMDEIRIWEEKVHAMEEEGTSLREDITRLNEKVQKLEKVGARDYEEITALNQRIHKLEAAAADESRFATIGKEVRIRFLENTRVPNMGKDFARIKSGNRAAHRGRPIQDALLFVTGGVEDPLVCKKLRKVYSYLYGVSPETMMEWKEVQEMVDVAGFRASLQSESQLTEEFGVPFERLKTLAMMEKSSSGLRSKFEAAEVNELKKLHTELDHCYDKLTAERRVTRQWSAGEHSSPANGYRRSSSSA